MVLRSENTAQQAAELKFVPLLAISWGQLFVKFFLR